LNLIFFCARIFITICSWHLLNSPIFFFRAFFNGRDKWFVEVIQIRTQKALSIDKLKENFLKGWEDLLTCCSNRNVNKFSSFVSLVKKKKRSPFFRLNMFSQPITWTERSSIYGWMKRRALLSPLIKSSREKSIVSCNIWKKATINVMNVKSWNIRSNIISGREFLMISDYNKPFSYSHQITL
jgi:hypothetical protein